MKTLRLSHKEKQWSLLLYRLSSDRKVSHVSGHTPSEPEHMLIMMMLTFLGRQDHVMLRCIYFVGVIVWKHFQRNRENAWKTQWKDHQFISGHDSLSDLEAI